MAITERRSNIEALRIVCALMIVFVHSNFLALGRPNWEMLSTQTATALGRLFLQFVCVPATYTFILISGYFGIKVKFKSVANLLFILLFWKAVTIVARGFSSGWSASLFLHNINPFIGWFIPAYVVLLLFVPALNAFADAQERDKLARYLLLMVPIVILLDCSQIIKSFNGGYSALALMMAYLIGKYIGKPKAAASQCETDCFTLSALIGSFFGLIVLWIVSYCGVSYCFRNHPSLSDYALNSLCMYTFPAALLCSILLFLIFMRLKIQSRAVNWIGLSAFPIIGYHLYSGFRGQVGALFCQYDGLLCVGMIALHGFLVSVSILAIDQARIVVWRKLIARVIH